MIKLKSLELQGFRKFVDLTRIEFPESGLMLLDGDSGAGKSTVLQAIAYALDICPYPATTLKSWSGESLQVHLTLDIGGVEVKVSRGRVNAISDGSGVRTGSKAVEEGLRAIFGMSPDLLSALTYRPQDKLGLFLSKGDPEKKEFLAKVLGLESIEGVIESAQEARKDLANRLQFAQGILTEREAGLRKVLEQIVEVSPDPDGAGLFDRWHACQEVVKRLDGEVEVAREAVNRAYGVFQQDSAEQKAAQESQLRQAKTFLSQFRDANTKSRADFEARFSRLKDQVHQTDNELRLIDDARRNIAGILPKLKALKSNTCYTCNRPWTAELGIDELQEELNRQEARLISEPVLRKRRDDLLVMVKELKWVPDDRESKFANIVGQLESDIRAIGKNITDQRVIQAQERLSKIMNKLVAAKGDLTDARQVYHEFQRATEFKQNQRAKAESAKNDAVKNVDDQRAEVARLESELFAEQDFLQMLGREGFLGVIFDEVLTEIATQANEILGKLSNTSHVSVHFRSETTKGKKSIVPVFVVSGHETTRDAGLSGGMGTSADLAVDLGVAAVVESRLGSAPGWFCLDETFNGMPKATKESALEILQQFAQDRLVLVIDHGSEMKEMFGKVLTVREVNGRSVV
jgi:DNA repair exonuclease SbcCD ATPase subunit